MITDAMHKTYWILLRTTKK